MNRQPMHTVHLHGHLAQFGPAHKLAVSSPREAIRALATQIDGFADAMRRGGYRLVRGQDSENGLHYSVPYDLDGKTYDVSRLCFSLGRAGEDFHIVPEIAGAGGNGTGKIILGTVIMAAAMVGAGIAGAGFVGPLVEGATLLEQGMSMAAAFSVTWGNIATFGGALVLAGVGQMLQPSVSANYEMREQPDQRASFFLGGKVNQTGQGGPVILAYGRCRVGSTVISAGLAAEDMSDD